MIYLLSCRKTCFPSRLTRLVALVSVCFLIPKFYSEDCFGDENGVSTAESREVELKYTAYLKELSLQVTGSADSNELQFWKSVSNLKEGRLVVWSILDREYGAEVESGACYPIPIGPPSLRADGRECNVWVIKEPSSHELRHRQFRASLRHKFEDDHDSRDYECIINSIFKNGDWEFVSLHLIPTDESVSVQRHHF